MLSGSSPLNLSASFPLELHNTGGVSSPLSGSISPELSCGWATGANTTGSLSASAGFGSAFPSEPDSHQISSTAESDLASNFQQLTQFLKASSGGSSYSDVSDSAENPNSSRLSPRSNNNGNVLFLVDPNGRPFTVDVSTGKTSSLCLRLCRESGSTDCLGETQWINDMTAGHGLLHPFAAATMN